MLCCNAPQDDRLFVAFTLFTEDYEGLMSLRELFHFLNALLIVLLAPFTSSPMPALRRLTASELSSVCNIAAQRAATQLFAARAKPNASAKLSFYEFVELCTAQPHLVPWLKAFEWLDLAQRAALGAQASTCYHPLPLLYSPLHSDLCFRRAALCGAI
jgi:hypothetical protein